MRRTSFTHEFVESFPDEFQESVLYVSIPYASAAHLCACGCGNKVVTPIKPRPVGWQLLFDGKTVSLTPSIGNWAFPCRSHYWITSDTIEWDRAWTPEEVTAGRRREARDLDRYFSGQRPYSDTTEREADAAVQPDQQPQKRLLARVWRRLKHF